MGLLVGAKGTWVIVVLITYRSSSRIAQRPLINFLDFQHNSLNSGLISA
jgi:hypothetical protein